MSQPNKDKHPSSRKHARPDDIVIRLEQRARQLELELDKAKSDNFELQNRTASAYTHAHTPAAPAAPQPLEQHAPNAVHPPPPKQPHVEAHRDELENQAREQGGLFCIQHELFLFGGVRLFNQPLRRSYRPAERYDPEVADGLAQGQLHEIHEFLPLALRPYEREPWFAKAFALGVRTQRSQAVHRIKNVCAPLIFGVSANDLLDPEHKLRMKAQIGYIADPVAGPHYSIFDVPILHKDHTPTLDRSKLFMSDELIKIYITIIRALGGLHAFNLHQDAAANTRATLEEMHGIDHPTDGAISGAAVLAIFCLSLDPEFRARGAVTKINYYGIFNEYKRWLQTGREDNKECVINIIRYWKHAVFPAAPPIRRNPAIDWVGQERARAMAALKDDAQALPEDAGQAPPPAVPDKHVNEDTATHNEQAAAPLEQGGNGDDNQQQTNMPDDDGMDVSSELSYVDDGSATVPDAAPQKGSQSAVEIMDLDDPNTEPYDSAGPSGSAPVAHRAHRARPRPQIVFTSPPESPVPAPTKKATNARRGTRRGRGGH